MKFIVTAALTLGWLADMGGLRFTGSANLEAGWLAKIHA